MEKVKFRKFECEEYYFDFFYGMKVILLPTTIIFYFPDKKYNFILENIDKDLIKNKNNIYYITSKLQEQWYWSKRFHREAIEYFMENYYL